MGVSWTQEQRKVIDTRSCNILVSAAAGSGKTAVLVERILQLITDEHHPVDIDRLLIVTFTRAAAGEMKERIRSAIEKKLETDRDNEHLQRQSVLVHHAQITTIDSFCSYVVKNYFHLIDLDPSFRMGDEGEMRLLQADVADKVMEEAYAKEENHAFAAFVDGFSGGKTDEKIPELIQKLYGFSMSYPYPKEWLESCKKAYEIQDVEELERAPWMACVKAELAKETKEAAELLGQAVEICRGPDGPGFYLELLETEKAAVEKAQKAESFREWKEVLESIEFKRLPAGKKAEKEQVSPERQELAKNLRSQAKDFIKELQERYFGETMEEMAEHLRLAGEPVGVLVDLTLRFMELYQEKKKEKNILDFADLEHYALEILVEHTEEGDKRTNAAKELAEQFAEIMIDEYQDSNLVQEKLLSAVSGIEDGIYNIFMVGDVKQSIYRFRLARPDLFMEKFRTYPLEQGGEKLRIDLHRNFRSRKEVLESVNYLFYQIMGEDLGGVEYDQDAALYPQREFPPKEITEPAAEVFLLEEDDPVWKEQEDGQTARELEAKMTALRIRELMEHQEVLDKETEQYRKVRYSDITILLRTMSGWAETFKKVLNASGIPASVTTKTGYFSATEVTTVLDYLQILDNPLQDIPLAGAMRGLPDGFQFQELAEIKVLGQKEEKASLFEAVLLAEKLENPLGEKVRRFLGVYRKLRSKVPYTPMHELLWDFFDETGFLLYQQAFVSGEQKKANLLMLVEKARAYESTSYRGLFNFIRYIENLKKYQVDFGEANILSEKEDTVRIMSIHGSKGLEFPIVFVAGLGKQMNLQDARESIVLHPDLGIGAPCVDEKFRIRTRTILQKTVQQEITLESLGEELRILYVALTRAKEKLILTGTLSKLEEKLTGFEKVKHQESQRLSYGIRMKGKSYLDWILAALARHKAMKPLYEAFGQQAYALNPWYDGPGEFFIRRIAPLELVVEETQLRTEEMLKKGELLMWDCSQVYDKELRDSLQESFSYEYPYEALGQIPAKLTVSEVKRMQQMEEEDSALLYGENMNDSNMGTQGAKEAPEVNARESSMEERYVPAFMREEAAEVEGAKRGTVYHRILECLDYTCADTLNQVKAQLEAMVADRKLTPAMRKAVKDGEIYQFVKSPMGQRMQSADRRGELHREQPFVISVPANQIKEEYDSREEILIQGIMDAYFEEEGELVLVDYKTDKVWNNKIETLVEKYQVQLRYYKEALERVTGKKVKETYIYSLQIGKAVEVVM